MPSAHVRLTLDEFLPYRLSVLSNRISKAIADRYESRFNMSLPQWRVMAVLGETPDLSANTVADKTAMDKVAVSRAVNQLLDSGRIVRHFDPSDRRRSVLALSELGQAIYEEIVPLASAYEADLIAALSDDDFNHLNRIIDNLAAHLDKMDLGHTEIDDKVKSA